METSKMDQTQNRNNRENFGLYRLYKFWLQANKRQRNLLLVLIAIVVVTIIGILFAQSPRTPADRVIRAVRASFPNFCQNGQILAEIDVTAPPPLGRYFGIKCDSWLKGPGAFYGYATDIDVEQCTTRMLRVDTLGVYLSE